ncbi:vWA domain-containing protein [Streptomyces halobius]|uniref:VWA domain-containing protein n=1 Tax=Streptomyces halobius TaxID=2879846 RepID=A0ABY4M9A5_9ACTN|nr:VWA domain-containing protein [Streptomyces halobius]UQA94369.1 VWA domain-containing protein [Streptomyces halobius]
MGIRSLLRNAFGRSKATREETGAAPSSADTPESATIPEAREESTPVSATPTPEPEVPAARTAPAESPAPEPEPTPTTATLPAQGSPVDSGTAEPKTTAATAATAATEGVGQTEEVVATAGTAATASSTAIPAADAPEEPVAPLEAIQATHATEAAETAEATEELKSASPIEIAVEPKADTISDLVSRAFDNPAPVAADPEPATEPAKAEPKPKPKPEPMVEAEPMHAPAPEPTPAKATTPDTASATPAISLTKVESTAPGLVSLYKSAGVTLQKHGLATQRAAVYLVLDRSGSMRNYYKDGTVQHLAEQALGLSANLDDDGIVPVVFFSTDVDGTTDLDLTNYEGRIEELHSGLGHMGRTNYHWAINAVVEHYKKSGSEAPAFVIFQTDGAPTSKPAAEKALCEAAELPIFWQFIGFGDPDAKGFDFLRKLDDLAVPEKRVVDNAGFFHAGRDPRSLSADELYQQLMVEFPEWLTEARTTGVLKDN